jgi:AcrR family transcriptional regulator
MQSESARAQAMNDTRNRILENALEVLGRNPEAGMGDIASAAGVVRRTVYGHFPTRTDLVLTLAQQAADELVAALGKVNVSDTSADAVWADFIGYLWPLAHRYRVLVALRRGEYGQEIHARLGQVDKVLADLVQRGQDSEVFARHLPADTLSQVAYTAVFSIADNNISNGAVGVRAATIASLLILGVPEARATALADTRP